MSHAIAGDFEKAVRLALEFDKVELA